MKLNAQDDLLFRWQDIFDPVLKMHQPKDSFLICIAAVLFVDYDENIKYILFRKTFEGNEN